jgi:hypothetical protein
MHNKYYIMYAEFSRYEKLLFRKKIDRLQVSSRNARSRRGIELILCRSFRSEVSQEKVTLVFTDR